jgi:hypothetical protein
MFKLSIEPKECIYPCKHCDLKFISTDILEYHMERKHKTGTVAWWLGHQVGGFKCNQCEKGFKWHVSLQKHSLAVHKIKIHVDEKQEASCQLCLKQFSSRVNYKDHVKNVHIKSPEEMRTLQALEKGKPASVLFKIVCKFCTKSFLNLHVLNIHVSSVHRQEKKSQDWTCEFCKHVIKPSKNRSTQINKHIRSMHQIYYNESSLNSQIVQPRDDETLSNFNIMMQRLKADYGGH